MAMESASALYDRLYPGPPVRRHAALIRDLIALAIVAFFAWLGWRLYVRIDDIKALALGVQEAGTSVQNGFTSAANAVGGVPIIGDTLKGALNGTGNLTAGNVVTLGIDGENAIHRVAQIVGWMTFLLPTILVLLLYLPRRIDRIRTAAVATRMLMDTGDPERRRLLAMRAALSLPLEVLAKYTNDPIDDLQHERYDQLLLALRGDAGLGPQRQAITPTAP
jgi:hypothetical protein